ncbi:hypothetical protein Desru_0229 [Desulforamulus ruminis DSM 2154]|uniref:Uncharacterized protein n=1 Tax=Desulforamulus ruminis (strain ATCC 23193 / DSM 2154 / NCIMB 8452 / DL) TaxID=696281 RepID=F6DNI7_DESRL|nr:hypothetical protein Desru_0229 [Desulforamulus ruminis DSM 2154]
MVQKAYHRLQKMALSDNNIAILHNKNPWLPMWWSAALPGLGHLCQGFYIRGIILMSWEILLNFKGHINLAILYTFTGDFTRATQVLEPRWAIFYGVVFCFAIYDAYRNSVEVNMLARLERKQHQHQYLMMKMSTYGVNFLSKANPWVAAVWSIMLTGFGHIYNNKIFKALILLGWTIAIMYFANLNGAIIQTFLGEFERAKQTIDYQWLLFFPSIYIFGIWDAYNDSTEMSKVFNNVQKSYLKKIYGQGRKIT